MTFRTPKYSCTICNKVFRRKKQHFNHVIRNTCGKKTIRTTKEQPIVIEYTTMKPAPYIGREYTFTGLATGMRHLRSGLPLPRLNPSMRCAI